MLFLLGGLIPLLLFSEANRNKIQCNKCGYIFRQPPFPSNITANLTKCIFVLFVALSVCGVVLYTNPDLLSFVENYPWLVEFEAFIENNSRLVAVITVTFLVIFTFLCLVSTLLANSKSNRKIRQQFKTTLEPFPTKEFTENEEENEE